MAKRNSGTAVAEVQESEKVEAIVEKQATPEELENQRLAEIDSRDLSDSMGEEIPLHELAHLFPPMTDDEYIALKRDIATNGLLTPIYLADGKIVDGRHRYKATRELGIPADTVEWPHTGSLTNFVVSMNLNRRHLTTSQRAAIALTLLPHYEEEARQRMTAGTVSDVTSTGEDTSARAFAGRAMGVSGKTVSNLKKVQEEAPDLLEQVIAGKMTANKALREANERPNADGTPKAATKARQSSKPSKEDRAANALTELEDEVTVWLSEYSRISVLKPVTLAARQLLTVIQSAQSEGLAEGIDIDDPEASYDMEADDEEPTEAELAALGVTDDDSE